MASNTTGRPDAHWRRALHEVVFEAETPAGKAFDVALIWAILLSVIAVLLESVRSLRAAYGEVLIVIEWGFTVLFSIEYILRLLSVRRPLRYAFSFFGMVDLLAVAPTYFSLFFPGTQYLLTIRILRLLRIFRIFKLVEYVNEGQVIASALQASRRKISVFLVAVLSLVVIIGSLIYVIEGEANGFTDIPTSIYWAIVTMTTVGYGDMVPVTPLGKFIGGLIAIIGIGMVALPAGMLASGFSEQLHQRRREFESEVHRVLRDGVVSAEESARLQEIRERLGLPDEHAAEIVDLIARRRGSVRCPHCHKLLSAEDRAGR